MNVFATARYFLCSGWASSSLTVSSGRPKSALAFSQWTSPSRTTLMYAPPSNAAMKEPRQRSSSPARSEEHTSELQSLMRISYAVFCLTKKTDTKQLIHLLHHIKLTHID